MIMELEMGDTWGLQAYYDVRQLQISIARCNEGLRWGKLSDGLVLNLGTSVNDQVRAVTGRYVSIEIHFAASARNSAQTSLSKSRIIMAHV